MTAAGDELTLEPRQQQVLAAIVEEHIRTAEPVGSRAVKLNYQMSVSTATIRNDMMVLERSGFINQPHTSAGRVPSQKAYRFYVNRMLAEETPVTREWAWVAGEFRRTRRDSESVLRATTRLLSEVTRQPALASAPAERGPSLALIRLRALSSTSIRVDYATSGGESHEFLWELPRPLNREQIDHLGALLNSSLTGDIEDEAFDRAVKGVEQITADPVAAEALIAELRQARFGPGQQVFVDGMVHILRQPEFAQTARLTPVVAILDEEPLLRRLLETAARSEDVTVAIGSENRLTALAECTLVVKQYLAGPGRSGTVGVLGPMRMPYREVVTAVRTMAQRVAQLLNTALEQ